MKPLRLAVVGYGRVGKACGEAILDNEDLVLAAVVRRLDSLAQSLPEAFRKIPVVPHVAQVQTVEAALLCVPLTQVLDAAHECLQHGIPIVESSVLHGEAFQAHRNAIHRLAIRHKVPAIVGAGWDPGALSIFRSLFALLAPEGDTEISHRVGVSLHHTAMARRRLPASRKRSAPNSVRRTAGDSVMCMWSWSRRPMPIVSSTQSVPILYSSMARPWCFRLRVSPCSSKKVAGSCSNVEVRRGAWGINNFCSKRDSMNLC
jgi:hypothetical protein